MRVLELPVPEMPALEVLVPQVPGGMKLPVMDMLVPG